MDFLVGLPKARFNHDAIWVIIDRLTKSSHFLGIKVNDPLDKLAKLCIKEIVGYMKFFSQSYSIKIPILLPNFEPTCRMLLGPSYLLIWLSILTRMTNLN